MKKFLMVISIIGAVVLVTPVILGHFIEQQILKQVAALNKRPLYHSDYLQIVNYDKGLFSSEVKFTVMLAESITAADGTEIQTKLTFPLVLEVFHGPLTLDADGVPRLAWATGEINVSGADILEIIEDDPLIKDEAKQAIKRSALFTIGSKALQVIGAVSVEDEQAGIFPEAKAQDESAAQTPEDWSWKDAFLRQLEKYPAARFTTITRFDNTTTGSLELEPMGDGEPTATQPIVWGGGSGSIQFDGATGNNGTLIELAAAKVFTPEGVRIAMSDLSFSSRTKNSPQLIRYNFETTSNEMTVQEIGGDPSKVVVVKGLLYGGTFTVSLSDGVDDGGVLSGEYVYGTNSIRFPVAELSPEYNLDDIGFTFGMKFSGIGPLNDLKDSFNDLLAAYAQQQALMKSGQKPEFSKLSSGILGLAVAAAANKPTVSIAPSTIRLGGDEINFEGAVGLKSFDAAAFDQEPSSILTHLQADARASAPIKLTKLAISAYRRSELELAYAQGILGEVDFNEIDGIAKEQALALLAHYEAEGMLSIDDETVKTTLSFDGENVLVNGKVLKLNQQ